MFKTTVSVRAALIAFWCAMAVGAASAAELSTNKIPNAQIPNAQISNASVPDFAIDSKSAWLMVGDEFLPPPSGPGPVTFDKRYPYVDNATARRTGTQPTYRVADLSNPILQPWAVEEMRKTNEWVLAGKVPFRARERCYPAGGFWMGGLYTR